MRSARLRIGVSLVAILCALAPLRASADVDLIGNWYVLVHFKDDATANPDADRWLDLVWVFETKGSRLEWREYPLVIFDDGSGRFEPIPGNPRSRALAKWEPNAGQRAVIAGGPHVNSRGAKAKTLRGSATAGWKSVGRMASPMGAGVIGYQENLAIENPTTLPRLTRFDVVGNAYQPGSEGGSEYQVTEVLDDGQTLIGRYERDGHRRGVFRMWRTEPPRGLIEKEGTPNERMAERARATGNMAIFGSEGQAAGAVEGFDEGDDF